MADARFESEVVVFYRPRLCKNTNPKKIVGRETLPDTEKIEYSSI
ncbi:hypothetical protein CPter291_1849 [Collimonas pratensis]|uniref:Uncharacterized protein n=1 Tax=Collimonas pratensis TaxID=279113 RepID=A0ABM5Z5B4_9BURK|nr:hypothetical protein CPter291_1849 [Collimonas pratensis]